MQIISRHVNTILQIVVVAFCIPKIVYQVRQTNTNRKCGLRRLIWKAPVGVISGKLKIYALIIAVAVG